MSIIFNKVVLKMAKKVNFMLCVFYHNKKWFQRGVAGAGTLWVAELSLSSPSLEEELLDDEGRAARPGG